MASRLSILYRGPLSSCNYGCDYCPFAKRHETAAELKHDRECLDRFVEWISGRGPRAHSVFFTPWGEALTRPWYRDAVIRLSQLDFIDRVVVQTNLSCQLEWLSSVESSRVALWCTYHPSETTRSAFIAQCARLDLHGVAYSVGLVGLKEHEQELFALRKKLPPHVYVWVNAFKRVDSYYDAAFKDRLTAIDPLFSRNMIRHASRGKTCRSGESVIAVDGGGDVRRCHFVDTTIGNIYDENWELCLQARPCPNDDCGCHIGYVHLPSLGLEEIFEDGILERIPKERIWTRSVSSPPSPPLENAARLPGNQ